MRQLSIYVDCGDTTCASEPGKFCAYAMSSRFGTIWHCGLFKMAQLNTSKPDGDGWLLRCDACLAHEAK